jgi:predicted nucleotidyltransferase
MSSFNSLDLFGSGPHRFALGPQGEDVVPNFVLGSGGSGSTAVGPIELDVTVAGRLVAADESDLWTLRDAITVQLTDPPTAATLVDNHGHTWTGISFITYTEADRTDRGREWSIEYTAVFRKFI